MIKNIISIIFNLFNFHQPQFARLRYTDMVIGDKAYFLMSWELEDGYKLQIKNLKYRTYKRSGSAYMAIPPGTDRLELCIANVWRSAAQEIILHRESFTSQVDFFPVKKFETFKVRAVFAPQVNFVVKTPQLRGAINKLHIPVFAIHTKNLTQP